MNEQLLLLITRCANIYFWLFISISILSSLYMFTDEYKENKEILKRFGKVSNSVTHIGFIMWFLFILSMYYK
jgi:hypothetical protein